MLATNSNASIQLYQNHLEKILELADDPGLMVLYREMQSFEKDYLIARQRPLMQAAFNAAAPLREAIESAPTLEADQKSQALTHLDDYLTVAEGILELNVAINSKSNVTTHGNKGWDVGVVCNENLSRSSCCSHTNRTCTIAI